MGKQPPLIMQVAHAKNPNFGFAREGHPDPVYPADFFMVAVVEVPERQEPNPDHAFHLTNHIDRAWWENPGVTLVGEPRHRSTSVGDVVIMPNGRAMLCTPLGFRALKTPKKRKPGA